MDRVFRAYASFVTHHPWIVLALVILLTLGAVYGNTRLSLAGTSFESMFPEDLEVIQASNLVEDQFAGGTGMNIVLKVEPGGIEDVRDPRVVEYAGLIAERARHVENVLYARSIAGVLREQNQGILPSSKSTVKAMLRDNPQSLNYISPGYSISLVRLGLGDVEGKEGELLEDLNRIIETTPPPPGIGATPTGEPAIAVTFKELTGPDMAKTTQFSFLGILFVAIIIFGSVRYGVLPLISVTLGILWAFGLMGLLGIEISSTLAGVSSMVMGIGIDFAIQVINRFRQEKEGQLGGGEKEPSRALKITLPSVTPPMAITTLAALIGFQAMYFAQLRFMQDLGTVMSLGVLTSMGSAVTFVPSVLILTEKLKGGK